MPTISAVMLTMPGRAKLRRLALDCLLAQKHPVDELVLVFDALDGPTPTETALLAAAKLKVRHVAGKTYANVTEKYNAAISETTGEWITLWDDDDWSGPRRIERVVDAIAANPDAAIVGPNKILYHELVGPNRRTVWFETHAHVIDGAAAFKRSLWAATPFHLVRSIHPNAARMANIGDWIVKRVAAGASPIVVDFPYVAMIHGKNATMARPFRVNVQTGEVYDGPNDFTLAGERTITANVLGEETLQQYEAALR